MSAILIGAMLAGTAVAGGASAGVPTPVDTPYPGTLKLHVDASDITQGIFRVTESIPVRAGTLTLLYPQWIPGKHSPAGPIDQLAGLEISANGQPLTWTRDKYNVYAFQLEVPAGVKSIELSFQYLSARTRGQGPIEMTGEMLNVVWSKVSLYPAGHYSRQITVVPSVTLPAGWQFGGALEVARKSGATTRFKPVTYNTLEDSPLYAGKYFKRVDLDPGAKVPVHLDMVADAPKYLAITDEQIKLHRQLVQQAYKLYGSHHYDHYDFLLSLSEQLSGKGLEHHQSSENGVNADFFSTWNNNVARRDLLGHEYTHSWNGKFRRPADLWTPNFNVPMGDSLLWVYEGQTQYWGQVLTARAGLWTPEQYRDSLAQVAARYDRGRTGFEWRTLEDTTNDPTIARRAPLPYRNWQMSEEYYSGGQMLWLAADTQIRAQTRGKKSLDDFAKAFFGIDNGSYVTRTYSFDDVVAALNGVTQYDWAKFLRTWVDAREPPLLDGLRAAGWKLVYTDTESAYEKQLTKRLGSNPAFMYSIGLAIGKDGQISDVRWHGPAFKAGIGSGASLVAVNGHAYSAEVLQDAIRDAKGSKTPIELLLKYQDRYRTVPVAWHEGLQHPHLERISGTPDLLSKIIKAK